MEMEVSARENAFWKEVLVEKYGQKATDLLVRFDTWPRYASRWWKDLVNLEGGVGQNWFNTEMMRKVGNKYEFLECGMERCRS